MPVLRDTPKNIIAMDAESFISSEDLSAFLDGNADTEEASRILQTVACDDELAETLLVCSLVDDIIEEKSPHRIIPMRALAAANPDNLCSFKCEERILSQLGFDVDHWTLLETSKANNWLREEGTPLHHVGRLLELKGVAVVRKYNATLDDVRVALADGMKVIVALNNNGADASPKFHAVNVVSIGDEVCVDDQGVERYIDRKVFEAEWEPSGRYMVCASTSQPVYNPQPIDVADIALDNDLVDLTEAIAENAHDTWARARMDEGWRYGPVRDDKLKEHPDLVPYSKLTEGEKEYDRIMAMNTLRLVRRLGFEIVNMK